MEDDYNFTKKLGFYVLRRVKPTIFGVNEYGDFEMLSDDWLDRIILLDKCPANFSTVKKSVKHFKNYLDIKKILR